MTDEPLSPYHLRIGYAHGVFPMGMEDGRVHWFRPFWRALFPIEGLRVSRSLARTLRKGVFEVRFDTSFEAVMRGCLRPTDNWINEEIIRAFTQAHREGWAHCAECWQDGELVGGVYGLAVGACFSAESMFYRRTDASKVALKALIDRCRELGFVLFDAQVMNPHLERLGAFAIPQAEYVRRLRRALRIWTPWSGPPFDYEELLDDADEES